jgi:hypothetical protein
LVAVDHKEGIHLAHKLMLVEGELHIFVHQDGVSFMDMVVVREVLIQVLHFHLTMEDQEVQEVVQLGKDQVDLDLRVAMVQEHAHHILSMEGAEEEAQVEMEAYHHQDLQEDLVELV